MSSSETFLPDLCGQVDGEKEVRDTKIERHQQRGFRLRNAEVVTPARTQEPCRSFGRQRRPIDIPTLLHSQPHQHKVDCGLEASVGFQKCRIVTMRLHHHRIKVVAA